MNEVCVLETDQIRKAPVRRRQPELVKARILRSALNIFATHGFEGASVRAIAGDAHTSISLLLYHFGSKEELWRATIQDVFAKAGRIDEGLTGSAADRLAAMIERSVRVFAEYPALHRLMTLEGHQPTQRLIWLIDTYIRANYQAWCALIVEAQRDGAVIDGDPSQMRMAITAMCAVPFSVSAEYQYLSRQNPFSKSEIETTIALIQRMIFKSAR